MWIHLYFRNTQLPGHYLVYLWIFLKTSRALDGNLNKKSRHFIKQIAHLLHTKIRLCNVTSKYTRKSLVGFYKSMCMLGCKSNMKVKMFKHASIFFATCWNLVQKHWVFNFISKFPTKKKTRISQFWKKKCYLAKSHQFKKNIG